MLGGSEGGDGGVVMEIIDCKVIFGLFSRHQFLTDERRPLILVRTTLEVGMGVRVMVGSVGSG